MSATVVRELLLEDDSPSVFFEKYDNRSKRPLYSVIAVLPFRHLEIKGNLAISQDYVSGLTYERVVDCPFTCIQEELDEIDSLIDAGEIPERVRFAAGLIGYLGYGLVRQVEAIATSQEDPFVIPDAKLIFPSIVVYLDHQSKTVDIVSHRGEDYLNSIQAKLTSEKVALLQQKEALKNELINTHFHTVKSISALELSDELQHSVSADDFKNQIVVAKEHIVSGEVFQIVLSHRMFTRTKVQPQELLDCLGVVTPSTYRYMVDFSEFQYVGASPEKMVCLEDGEISLCALAGTRPRGMNAEEDDMQRQSLVSCEKERAEHLMLVDLARNDLGKVCTPGSIRVGPIAQVLEYANVMHLGTEITGRLEEGSGIADTVKACFPRGTVSGAPKVRAMQLIARLEREDRGIYAGAVGFMDVRREVETAIAIRSALFKDGSIHVNAGAGVVYDSTPESEYMETINKAASITRPIKVAERLSESLDAHESQAFNHGGENEQFGRRRS
ncbi:MAG: anthranilate synthase component I family protein [Cyanobacteria bacterium]|nr:anthranilate synthase component I family protein [Cyanobacteriota bacterium]